MKKRPSGSLKLVALTILVGAAGYYGYRMADLYQRQGELIFHPNKAWTATPDALGLPYENVSLLAADGVQLSAWFVSVENAKGSVIFFHGDTRNISSDTDALEMFSEAGYNTLTVDYRGYGKSEGEPGEAGFYLDAEAAWDWLTEEEGEKPGRIVICGRSLGSAIAADLASKHAAKALIIEAAFTSLTEIAVERYPYFPVRLFLRHRFETLSKISSVSYPVLIVHSADDELIPFSHAKRLYAAAPGKKAIVEIGGPHKGGWQPTLPKYFAGVKAFLAGLDA